MVVWWFNYFTTSAHNKFFMVFVIVSSVAGSSIEYVVDDPNTDIYYIATREIRAENSIEDFMSPVLFKAICIKSGNRFFDVQATKTFIKLYFLEEEYVVTVEDTGPAEPSREEPGGSPTPANPNPEPGASPSPVETTPPQPEVTPGEKPPEQPGYYVYRFKSIDEINQMLKSKPFDFSEQDISQLHNLVKQIVAQMTK